jgi:hypothetical protein
MADDISSALYVRGCYLRHQLRQGDNEQIKAARDQLRAIMIAHKADGYWRDKPELLRTYMDLLYRCDRILARLGPGLGLAKRTNASFDNQVS